MFILPGRPQKRLAHKLSPSSDNCCSEINSPLYDRVSHYLQPFSNRILMIGLGCGCIYAEIIRRNHKVTGIDTDPISIELARKSCSAAFNHSFISLPWQRYEPRDQDWEAVFFNESLCFCDPLMLYSKAYDALTDNGCLIILNKFMEQRIAQPIWNGLPVLNDFITLAVRCGFWIEEQCDLTISRLQSILHRLETIQKRQHLLHRYLLFNHGQQAKLRDNLKQQAEGYTTGNHIYVLLILRKIPQSRWRISNLSKRALPEIFSLFRQVFGHEMKPVLWDWKYGKGRGQAAITWREGKVVAHYGVMARLTSYLGESRYLGQIGDVMVDPGERGILTRKGPFFLMAASIQEATLGFCTKHLIGFGFPNARALQVGIKYGLYAPVGTIVEVYWQAITPDNPRLRLQVITRDANLWLRWSIERLWHTMRTELSHAIVGVRNWAWLLFRYLSHPCHDYHVFLISGRINHQAKGIIVLRSDGERCELMDVVAPLRYIPLLLNEARRLAAQWGKRELYCWITASYANLFETSNSNRRELGIMVPTNVWTTAPAPAELRDRWWLMSGDTDFR